MLDFPGGSNVITWALKIRRKLKSRWEIWGRRRGLGDLKCEKDSICLCWLWRLGRGPWAEERRQPLEAKCASPLPPFLESNKEIGISVPQGRVWKVTASNLKDFWSIKEHSPPNTLPFVLLYLKHRSQLSQTSDSQTRWDNKWVLL